MKTSIVILCGGNRKKAIETVYWGGVFLLNVSFSL